MRRSLLALVVLGTLALASHGSASAGVRVRIAVSPDSIPQCSVGHGVLLVANDGATPILARVCFALMSHDTTLVGPLCGRVPLAAGETRTREFAFLIPPRMSPGDYAFVVHVAGSDGSSDQSAAIFTVKPSTFPACVPPPAGATNPAGAMLDSMMQSAGVSPDGVTATSPSSWGQVKILYR